MDAHLSSPDDRLPDDAIFIGGAARSGKTYVRLMLAAHPAVAFSKRANLWTHHCGRYGDLAADGNLDRCLAALWANRHVRALEPDAAGLRREFRRGSRTYPRLFALLHRRYAAREGKSRWGDQTEEVEEAAGAIFAALPNARFIHLIRDPRDRYEALGDGRSGRLGDAVARWRRSAEAATRHERRYPDRYLVVRYEALAAEPAETLHRLCAFLGLAPTDDMLALGHAPRFGDVTPGGSPLTPAYIGRFRGRLAGHEIAFIQQRAGSLLARFGYEPEPVELTWGDRVRCRALTPATAALVRAGGELSRRGTRP